MAEAVPLQKRSTVQLPDMTAAANRALDLAFESCARLMQLATPSAAAYQMQHGNAVARMHCCTSITREIAQSLGASDQNVRAIFAPDYDLLFQDLWSDTRTQPKPMVSLMVWTRQRTAKLGALVTAWDRALVQACRDRLGSDEQTPLLDVHIVDDIEIRQRLGADRSAMTATRLAVHWMGSTNQVVDIVYDQGEQLE